MSIVSSSRSCWSVCSGLGIIQHGWLAFVCPLFLSVYYMFVASITRYARAAHEGISPRTGIFWAAFRQLGSMFLSYALVLVPAVAVMSYAESHAAAESTLRNALVVENVEYMNIGGTRLQGDKWISPTPLLYVLYFAVVLLVWSPVVVKLARHF